MKKEFEKLFSDLVEYLDIKFSSIDARFEEIDKRFASMPTKEYIDDKIANLRVEFFKKIKEVNKNMEELRREFLSSAKVDR